MLGAGQHVGFYDYLVIPLKKIDRGNGYFPRRQKFRGISNRMTITISKPVFAPVPRGTFRPVIE